MRNERLSAEGVIAGALAGLIATVPMTATMLLVSRFLIRKRQPLYEPRKITNETLHRSGLSSVESIDEQRGPIQIAAHLGYGAAVGSLYPFAHRLIPLPEKFRGPAYGVCVYAASYAAWLPALDILPPPQRRPIGRNVLLIAAHLVWGASLAEAYRRFRRRQHDKQPARRDKDFHTMPEVAQGTHHTQRTS